MRHVLVDIGSGYRSDLAGKDLILTNAPAEVLATEALKVNTLSDGPLPAEELFFKNITERGYKIEALLSLEDAPMVRVEYRDE